jgi:glycine betaine/proline transport system permease protein
MEFLTEFPSLGKRDLRDLKKAIDGSFREWSRTYGDGIEAFFDPLYFFLVWLEKLLIATPWPIILIIVAGLAFLGSRSWQLS